MLGRRVEILKLREDGHSLAEIGRRLGISKQRVHQLLHEEGVTSGGDTGVMYWTRATWADVLIDEYARGRTPGETYAGAGVSEKLGRKVLTTLHGGANPFRYARMSARAMNFLLQRARGDSLKEIAGLTSFNDRVEALLDYNYVHTQLYITIRRWTPDARGTTPEVCQRAYDAFMTLRQERAKVMMENLRRLRKELR